jgi:uncharacterized RmlC-like cupin family protein
MGVTMGHVGRCATGALMRQISKWIWLAAFSAASPHGQSANQARTQTQRDGIENATVRVVTVNEQPHQPSPPHERPMNRVLVFRDAGQMTWTAGGKVEKLEFKAGDMKWDPAGSPYVSENITDHPVQVVVIELKSTPKDPPLVLSNLDMLVSDSEHYKLAFENDQVRVLRVRYGPHEKGNLHQHARGRVIVNLSPELRAKYGDVRWAEAETHQETNDADYAVERLAVEAK